MKITNQAILFNLICYTRDLFLVFIHEGDFIVVIRHSICDKLTINVGTINQQNVFLTNSKRLSFITEKSRILKMFK